MQSDPDHDDLIIKPDQDWQCRWWSKALGVTPDTLKKAIREAGPLARNVRLHLKAAQRAADAESLPAAAARRPDLRR